MKILGPNKEVLAEVTLCLTPAEARELANSAAELVDHPEKHHHHVSSSDFQTEITVAVYTRSNISGFAQDLQDILRDECESD